MAEKAERSEVETEKGMTIFLDVSNVKILAQSNCFMTPLEGLLAWKT